MNTSRIEKASAALEAHARDGSDEENVIDLLADMMHYCRARKVSWDNAIEMAERHFINER